MKIRHDGRIYEHVGTWTHPSGKVYGIIETAFEYKAVPNEDCKPLEETWQDVTGECGLRLHNGIQYLEDDDACVAKLQLNNHRLRRVQFIEIPNYKTQPVTDHVTAVLPRVWAFILERKVSE